MLNNEWTTVCSTTDLVIGSGICVLLGNEQVAIYRETAEGDIFAISNFDPVSEVNVLSRGIIGSISGELVVASPLYKQHYSLDSGQCLEDEDVQVKTYTVRENGGQVQLKPISSK